MESQNPATTTVEEPKFISILKHAINFAKHYKNKINLYKTPEFQNKISTLSQESLISSYNKLAGYYLKKAELENEENRDHLIMEATQYISKATDLSYLESSITVNRGYSSLISGQLGQAEREFDHVMKTNPVDILSLLGKGSIMFNREKYEQALKFYKTAIEANPLIPLSVYNACAT